MTKMNEMIQQNEVELKELGPGLPLDSAEKMKFLWQIINDFLNQYSGILNGTYQRSHVKAEDKIPPGSRVRTILSEIYDDKHDVNICDQYSDSDIQNAILRHEGDSIPGFPSIDSFLSLLVPQLEKLREPAQANILEIHQILEEIATAILNKVLSKMIALKPELQEIVTSVL